MIFNFSEINRNHIEQVGGKGANLGEMVNAGLPVPPGFCISADAYRLFIKKANLWPTIERILKAIKPGDVASLEKGAKEIRSNIEESRIPTEIVDAVKAAYNRLGSQFVAVRSSATAEDLPEASFAGQQETFLNIFGEASLLEHVRRCWASLWTARAISYREKANFDHEKVHLAVVVQSMVESEIAGVLFTANPLNGHRDEVLINASYGLGESIVSGVVTPDTYTLSKEKETKLLERILGAKEVKISSLPDGNTIEEEVEKEDRDRFCLSNNDLEMLVKMGIKVETYYGAPQDIEWAFSNGQVFLLQSRPITTLTTSDSMSETSKKQKLTRAEQFVLDDMHEHYPDPPYPLDYFAIIEGSEPLQQTLRKAGMVAPTARDIILMNDDGLPSINPIAFRPGLRIVGLPFRLPAYFKSDGSEWFTNHAPKVNNQLEKLRSVNLTELDNPSLANHLRSAMDLAIKISELRFDFIVPMIITGKILLFLTRLAGIRDAREGDLLGGLVYKTVEINSALQQLFQVAVSDPNVRSVIEKKSPKQVLDELEKLDKGQEFRKAFTSFLKLYGDRSPKAKLPFSAVSWSEEPGDVLASIGAMIRSEEQVGNSPKTEKLESESKNRFEKFLQSVTNRIPGPFKRFFLSTINNYRSLHVVREDTLFVTEGTYAVARRAAQEAGRRLSAEGVLSEPAQILFLTLPELLNVLHGRLKKTEAQNLIARREKARPKAEMTWRGDTYKSVGKQEGILTGQSGSSGMAKGPVKVIKGPDEFNKLQSGDVLVCPFTDPSWTPLFGLASAVVADTGGSLSHAAIVAREYGIPAVLGTRTGTTGLKDGDVVLVDGSRGIVRIE